MLLPVGCAWCGLPLVEGFNHRACTADRGRELGEMPLWHYSLKRFDQGHWGVVIEAHVAQVADEAAHWANDNDLNEAERARYVGQVMRDARDLGWEQHATSEPPYLDRRAMVEQVTEERRMLARYRAPDGLSFRGVV